MSPSKEVAPANISAVSVTDEVSQLERSPSKEVALLNIQLISVTDEVSQSEMSPLNDEVP